MGQARETKETNNVSEQIMAGHTVSVHEEEKAKPDDEKVRASQEPMKSTRDNGQNLEEKENKEKVIWNKEKHSDKTEDARGI
jgi:hypothetical protein